MDQKGLPDGCAGSRRPTQFVRHELLLGCWRETVTADCSQPPHGFTLSAVHTRREIALLRSAWERGAALGLQQVIRRLAQLSVRSTDSASRRFLP